MATSFWLLMGYNFGCVTASDMLSDSGVFGVKLFDEDTADFEVPRDVAMATISWLSAYGAHLRHLTNRTETVHMRWQCGLMSNYFDHLLHIVGRYCNFVRNRKFPKYNVTIVANVVFNLSNLKHSI